MYLRVDQAKPAGLSLHCLVLVRSASEFGYALPRPSLLRHGGILSTRSSTTKIGKIAVAATLVALTHGQLASAAPRMWSMMWSNSLYHRPRLQAWGARSLCEYKPLTP